MQRLGLLAVAALAIAAAPAAAGSHVQTGHYYGSTPHHGTIFFTLSDDRHQILNFKIGGHVFSHSMRVEYTPSTGHTHFGTVKDGIHLSGRWSGDRSVSGHMSWHSGGQDHQTTFAAFYR